MRSTNSFTLLFLPKSDKARNGVAPLYVRITVNGKRAILSLKRQVEISKWDAASGKLRGSGAFAIQINNYVNNTRLALLKIQEDLLNEGRILTAEAIKARHLGDDETFKKISDILNYHKTQMKRILKPGTLKNYVTTERYLYQFVEIKYKAEDFYLKQLNYQFITAFEIYLKDKRLKNGEPCLSNNGVMKHLERLKKLINLAQKLEWIDKEPFAKFSLHFDKVDKAYLTKSEVYSLSEFHSERTSLVKTKDIFLFACYTGLAYIDVKNLTSENIVKGIDGNDWIFTSREKTATTVKIPLLKPAKEILQKYKSEESGCELLLPVCSNQKMNKYLKEIATGLKIKKNLTFHVARHTFATTITLSNGVPLETVSKLLGHTKLATTQIYARVLEEKLSSDITILQNMLSAQDKEKQLTG